RHTRSNSDWSSDVCSSDLVLSQKDEAGHIVPGTVPEEADCALVLGGDGTLIRAVRDMGGCAMPLLGINLGTLGYLTDVELKEFRSEERRVGTEWSRHRTQR